MNKEPIFGFYSVKQLEVMCDMKMENNRPYVYYYNIQGDIVQITQVLNTNEPNVNFPDTKCLGEMSQFYTCRDTPLK